MKKSKKTHEQEQERFWAIVDQNKREVAKWPKWQRDQADAWYAQHEEDCRIEANYRKTQGQQ